MSKEIEFRCRICGDQKLFETMVDVTVSSECSLTDGGIDYGDQSNEDGSVQGYQCSNGHEVKDLDGNTITDSDDLLDLFGEHPVLSHDDVVALIADRLRLVDAESLVIEYARAFPEPKLRSLDDSDYYVLEEGAVDASTD